jgi:2'-5' RNA ligase
MSETTRAFLAVTLPDAAIAGAATVLSDLRPRCDDAHVKWVRPENLHVTLRFLGNVGAEKLAEARALVRDLDQQYAPAQSSWTALGAFPSQRRVQVIWLGLADEAGRLKALAREVNQQLLRAGFGRPDKAFRAHVTLGRARRGRRVAWASLSDRLTIPAGAFSIAKVALIKSTLTPQGPVYTPLETACARQ